MLTRHWNAITIRPWRGYRPAKTPLTIGGESTGSCFVGLARRAIAQALVLALLFIDQSENGPWLRPSSGANSMLLNYLSSVRNLSASVLRWGQFGPQLHYPLSDASRQIGGPFVLERRFVRYDC